LAFKGGSLATRVAPEAAIFLACTTRPRISFAFAELHRELNDERTYSKHLESKVDELQKALVFTAQMLRYNQETIDRCNEYSDGLGNQIKAMTADAAKHGLVWGEDGPEIEVPEQTTGGKRN
jgi:hypothetical protein